MSVLKTSVLEKRYATFLALILASSVLFLGACEIEGSDIYDDYEPNDSIGEAYPIELGESYSAYIAEDDVDFFEFETEHGSHTFDEVEISVTDVGPDLNIGIAVYDASRELIHRGTTNSAGANLTMTLPDLQSDDPYYVRFSGTWGVTGWEVGGIGDSDTEGRYTFQVRNLNANDEFAGNHSIDDAHPIEIGETYEGVLVSRNERDFYSFTPTSEEMRLEITDAGADLKTGVVLYGPNREVLGQQTTNTSGGLFAVDLNNMDTDATYFLRFNGTWGRTGWQVDGTGDRDSRGPYTFTVVDAE